jgi:hypothetical protein
VGETPRKQLSLTAEKKEIAGTASPCESSPPYVPHTHRACQVQTRKHSPLKTGVFHIILYFQQAELLVAEGLCITRAVLSEAYIWVSFSVIIQTKKASNPRIKRTHRQKLPDLRSIIMIEKRQ